MVLYLCIFSALTLIWIPLLLSLKDAFFSALAKPIATGKITTSNGLSVEIPKEILSDGVALQNFLRSYREHPDYDQLAKVALRHSRSIKK